MIEVKNPWGPRLLVGGPLLNGNFNANHGATVTFDATEAWYNTKGGQTQVATRSDVTYDGTQNGTLTSIRGFGVETGYSIIEGESFDFSYVWKDDGSWVDATDQVTLSLFVTDDNTITGARTDLVVDYSGIRKVNDAYEAISREKVYTATASDAGKTLFAAIETTSAGFARIDNFELVVRPAYRTFEVISAHGNSVPSGITICLWNSVVSASITKDLIESGTAQYECTGWEGFGSGLTNGTGTNVSFAITEDTTLTWQWTTNYWIQLEVIGE